MRALEEEAHRCLEPLRTGWLTGKQGVESLGALASFIVSRTS